MKKKDRKTRFAIDLGLSDIKIKEVKTDSSGDYHIYVSCTATKTKCKKCGRTTKKVHGHCQESIIEHLPILEKRVFIHVKWPRFICTHCENDNTTSYRPSWLNGNGQKTIAYEDYALKWLINSTIKDVAEKLKTTEEVIEGIVDRRIDTDIDWNKISPSRIGIDEIALRKGHKQYLTIVTDISVSNRVSVIAVIKGRTREDVIPFLKSIPKNKLFALEGIAIDMSGSYFSSLKEVIDDNEFFNRVVTIDRFHVAKLIGTKVDNERKKVLNKIKKEFENDEKRLNKIKHTMWPFRHHEADLSDEEKIRLHNLFEEAPHLKECYDIRESLYKIFEKNISKDTAEKRIDEWIGLAVKYKEKDNPFISFIDTYKTYKSNILNYFNNKCNSGPVEGFNNKIKVIKRRGYGFRNISNFAKRIFLDINLKPLLIPNQ